MAIHSISLPEELSEWVKSESHFPLSKFVQIHLCEYITNVLELEDLDQHIPSLKLDERRLITK